MIDCPFHLGVASIGLAIYEIGSLQSEEDIECILKSEEDKKVKGNKTIYW